MAFTFTTDGSYIEFKDGNYIALSTLQNGIEGDDLMANFANGQPIFQIIVYP